MTTTYIDQMADIWDEWKAPHWRAYEPRSSRATDEKRLWAVALSSSWGKTGAAKMQRLLTLFPRAVECAAPMPAFGARTTIWSLLRSAEGVELLANGVVPSETGRGWTSGNYEEQVIRLRLPEDSIAFVRAEAVSRGLRPSAFVTQIVEQWVAANGSGQS